MVRCSRLGLPHWTEDPHALKPEAMGSMKNNKLAGTLISRMLLCRRDARVCCGLGSD